MPTTKQMVLAVVLAKSATAIFVAAMVGAAWAQDSGAGAE